MKRTISTFLFILFPLAAYSLDCPKLPEQTNKDWDVEVKAAVGKIGPVQGAELQTNWELRGVYPKILQHEKHGEQARQLFADAQKLLGDIVAQKQLELRAVYGLFPANSVGDDVEVYTNGSRKHLRTTFHFLRQQIEKGDGTPNWCLADFIAPKQRAAGKMPAARLGDHVGAFAVTAGIGLKQLVEDFKAKHDDYNAIMAEALADRLAEAFAEYLHKRVREEWGYGKSEQLSVEPRCRPGCRD